MGDKLIERCAKYYCGRDDGKVVKTSVSMSLDTKGRFETGLKCLSTFGSSEGFSKGALRRRDYELHWKTRCYSDPHVQKKEDQFRSRTDEKNLCFVVI